MPQLKQNADASFGIQGTDGDDGAFVTANMQYFAGGATALTGFVASRRYIVKSIIGVPDTTTTNAVTATIYKAPSGTALGSGTALHTGTYNGQGTANTNQTLALTASACDIAAGNHIGIVWSGAPGAAGAGLVQVTLGPA